MMAVNKDELDFVAELMKVGMAFHVEHVKVGHIEIKFSPNWQIAQESDDKPLKEKIGMEHGNPTEEEMLFASAPEGPPNIKAEVPAPE